MPKKKQISRFMWLLILLSCAIFFLDYDERVLPYNSTILAFSYKYGFISRGLAGTIYQWIDHILPVNMIDYAMVLRFTLIVTLAFYVLFFAFCYQCMKRCQEEYLGRFLYLILFYAVFVVSMFAYKRNFGRLDLYLMALTVIGTMCLIAKKAEWLIVPLSMISVMYHQGYVFMFYNILLALLVYRLLSEKEKKARIYYGVILLVSLIGCSALFLWFEFFSHTDGVRYVDEIIANAKAMTKPFNGMTYHDTLIDHEPCYNPERPYSSVFVGRRKEQAYQHSMEWIIERYIVLAVKLFRRILARAQGKTERLKYGFLAIAAGTLLPLFLMKCDYARWVFALISYYCMIFLALVAMGDRIVAEELTGIFTEIKEKYPFAILLLLLPALLTPFWDVHINGLLRGISNPINETFLNLW